MKYFTWIIDYFIFEVSSRLKWVNNFQMHVTPYNFGGIERAWNEMFVSIHDLFVEIYYFSR